MAEAVVTFVLEKIGESAYQEALTLYGAEDKVAWAKRELEWVSAFLKDADAKAKQNLDNRVKQWVKNVKEVAYMIEDALDKFLVEVGGGPDKLSALKKMCNMPKILVARHRVSKKIDDIKERVREIRESAVNYGIEKLSDNSSGNGIATKPQRLPTLPDINETEVLGFESDTNNIVQQLTAKSDLTRSVISIVGAGGLGKTTLAKLVYKSADVKNHFGYCMWITISKEYDLIDILKRILKQIHGDDFDVQRLDARDLVRNIRSFLLEKTYLVVLDDVWSSALWQELRKVLPDDKSGSRALITTRSKEVALDANHSTTPYELQVLSKEKSLELMLSKAFPNQFANECADELLPLANQFANRCGGLPLALIVMGRILLKKHPDFNTWSELLGKIKWHTDGKECMEIVSTSYEELPLHLKLCFMYFATFPEDWEIKANPLLRLWVAEGFIPHEGIMEDTAENYLEELAQRCMIQVTKRSYQGVIRSCHIHDILHELAIHKAQEDNFLMVQLNSNNYPTSSSNPIARRIALRSGGTQPVGSIGPNLRSLTSYVNYLPNSKELQMARVVNLRSDEEIIYNLKHLKHSAILRYLKLDSAHSKEVDTSILSYRAPWKFLQTIDISTSILTCFSTQFLHDDFWKNRMLRHVIWSVIFPVVGPPSSANLENLLTLKYVVARYEWAVKLPHFPNIRNLKVEIVPDFDWAAMADLMSELEHLGSLKLLTIHLEEPMKEPCITPAFRKFRNMYKLSLYCRWPENTVIDSSICPPYLAKLELVDSYIRQDPMPELGKLPCLKEIILRTKSYVGERIVCSTGGFQRLHQLSISGLENLKEIIIESGTMPILNQLTIGNTREMEIVPDFQYLTNLNEINLWSLSHRFCSSLKGEDQHKVRHIPVVKLT